MAQVLISIIGATTTNKRTKLGPKQRTDINTRICNSNASNKEKNDHLSNRNNFE